MEHIHPIVYLQQSRIKMNLSISSEFVPVGSTHGSGTALKGAQDFEQDLVPGGQESVQDSEQDSANGNRYLIELLYSIE